MSKREEWMLKPKDGDCDPLSSLFASSSATKPTNGKMKKPVRELNPYLRNGGNGLPPDGQSPAEDAKHARSASGDGKGRKEETIMREAKVERLLKGSIEREIVRNISRDSDFKDPDRTSGCFRPNSSRKRNSREIGGDGFIDQIIGEKKHMVEGNFMPREKPPSTCPWCMEANTFDRRLIIAVGNLVYLNLPKEGYLGEFHCQITPIQHTSSTLLADDGVWEEIRNFKKCLWQLAMSREQKVVFLETVSDPSRPTHHTQIHAVFIPSNRPDPRSVFWKALMDSDEEWIQHARVIDTEVKGGLRKSIPQNLPYCYVDFRLDQGYAHVIENTQLVPDTFLLTVAADLLGVFWHSRRRVAPSKEEVETFRRAYEPFDWTKLLDEVNNR